MATKKTEDKTKAMRAQREAAAAAQAAKEAAAAKAAAKPAKKAEPEAPKPKKAAAPPPVEDDDDFFEGDDEETAAEPEVEEEESDAAEPAVAGEKAPKGSKRAGLLKRGVGAATKSLAAFARLFGRVKEDSSEEYKALAASLAAATDGLVTLAGALDAVDPAVLAKYRKSGGGGGSARAPKVFVTGNRVRISAQPKIKDIYDGGIHPASVFEAMVIKAVSPNGKLVKCSIEAEDGSTETASFPAAHLVAVAD